MCKTTSKYTKASVLQTAALVLPKSAVEVPLRSEMFGLVLNTRRLTKAAIKAPTWICFVGANMGLCREVKGGAREYFLAQGGNLQIFGGNSEGALPYLMFVHFASGSGVVTNISYGRSIP